MAVELDRTDCLKKMTASTHHMVGRLALLERLWVYCVGIGILYMEGICNKGGFGSARPYNVIIRIYD